ncbi:MAG TPA: efflux RND transporter periplasmic adaptor subunit [Ignavibacteriales bacterium]|nr:efflux RND transporter periplasmic adaptor subunit [Ignavibacteriales bacterium]
MANGKQKKSKKKLFIFGGIGALVLILAGILAFSGNKEVIIPVQTEQVVKKTITQVVAATGKINPEYQVVITPEVTGEIVELPVKEGDKVNKGQLLIRIKPDTYIAQRDRAKASLEASRATLNMRKSALERVESEYKRVEELYKKGLSSDQQMEATKADLASNRSQVEASQADVLQAEASLKEAIESLNKTAIYSPMNGVISQLNVELGERVLGSGFSQGTDIMTVADLSVMEARVEVDENDVVLVSVGDTARIEVDAFGEQKFNGVVTQIANSAKTTGAGTQEEVVNFEVRIRLVTPDVKVRPGMSCNADVETETKTNVWAVPIQSVTARVEQAPAPEDGNDNFKVDNGNGKRSKLQEIVFVAENGAAKKKEVKTGISDDTHIEIISGLDGKEKVISGPYKAVSRELNEGAKIQVEEKKNFSLAGKK